MSIESLNTKPRMFATNPISSSIFSNPVKIISGTVEKDHHNILERLLSNSGVGIWVFELKNGKISFCPVAKGYFHIAVEKEPTLHHIFKALEKEQRSLLIKTFENVCRENGTIECDIKLSGDGENVIWLKIIGKLYGDTPSQAPNLLGGTVVDITRQKMIEQKKEDAIAILSHELRSPLSTVRLYLQRVIGLSKNNRNDTIAEMLKKADVQVNSMLRLMDSLLHVSMLSNSRLELHYEEFNMIRLIHDIVNEMQLKFPWYKFALEFEGPIIVNADKDKIIQVLINYIGNAVKYSPEGSLVTIKCKKSKGSVYTSVNDQGIGIDSADQGNLFGRYYRTVNSGRKGCGLGLYLVKEIINLHKGEVWVNSAPGKGSAFYFSLPEDPSNIEMA